MSRDHRKLRVFGDAHQLTLAIYKHTRDFPKDEWFGLRSQMRRAAVSIPSNLVEGSARSGARDYCRFCNLSLGSACELKYLAALTQELGFAVVPTGRASGTNVTRLSNSCNVSSTGSANGFLVTASDMWQP